MYLVKLKGLENLGVKPNFFICMYNKLASIILNSAKNPNYAGEVFISQPDASKEKLAGKIFVLAELEGRKNDSQKIINFLINFFDYNYYGDEKILLRDKIEGLKIENIFEGVLARVNKGLMDFLQEEHFKINPQATNITLGVVYENKLYFSSYGKNKAFLIFRRRGNYEIINVEASAADEENGSHAEGDNFGKIFSAVITGEIPEYSYFFFANEALPEYLSNKELVGIVTKLPPMVAAEQIKNSLQRINSFAPFLGIIIKSTLGLNVDTSDDVEPIRVAAGDREFSDKSSRNAHSSISHLNYTERKTERMLAPAGIISLKKIKSGASALLARLMAHTDNKSQKVIKLYDDKEERDPNTVNIKEAISRKKELTHREEFAINDKLVFKKRTSNLLPNTFKSVKALAVIFSPSFWSGVTSGLTNWGKNLNKKNKVMVGAVLACIVILVISISVSVSSMKTKQAEEQFQAIIDNVNGKQEQIDAYMLYDNQDGALAVLNEAINLLNSNTTANKEQIAQKDALFVKLKEQKNKIQKITEISSFEETISVNAWNPGAQADSLALAKGQLYLADSLNKSIYTYNTADGTKNNLALSEQLMLTSPATKGDTLYYAAGSKVVKVAGQSINTLNIDAGIGSGQLAQTYKDYLYILNPNNSEVYLYSEKNNSFVDKKLRLANDKILGAVDFDIDEKGAMFIAKSTGITRFFAGKEDLNFKLSPVDPALRINKVIVTATNIYVLDLNNNRLVTFDKGGVLVKQYSLLKGNLQDVVVSEETKSAYILAGGSVYKFSL